MKVLFLSYYYKPDITAAAFRCSEFVDYLDQSGVDVRVITTYPHKSVNADQPPGATSVPTKRIALKPIGKRGFSSFLMHYLSFIPKSITQSIKWRYRGWKPDVIYISSPPIFIGITGIFLKYAFRRKLILEVRDIWPESAVAAGQLGADGMAFKLAAFFERFLYKRSNGIVCVSTPMKDYINEFYKKSVCVAYNGPKNETVLPLAQPSVKGEQKEIRIAYAGNLGLVQGMDQLLLAFGMLKQEELIHNWHLDIYGTGALEEELKEQTNDLGINDRVHYHGVFPKETLSEHLGKVDVLYLGLISSGALDKTIPSKLFDYMIFGKPILAAIKGEGKSILRKNRANLVLEACEANAIASGIKELDISLKERSLLASNNVDLLRGNYTREVNCEKILLYLRQVLGGS